MSRIFNRLCTHYCSSRDVIQKHYYDRDEKTNGVLFKSKEYIEGNHTYVFNKKRNILVTFEI